MADPRYDTWNLEYSSSEKSKGDWMDAGIMSLSSDIIAVRIGEGADAGRVDDCTLAGSNGRV